MMETHGVFVAYVLRDTMTCVSVAESTCYSDDYRFNACLRATVGDSGRSQGWKRGGALAGAGGGAGGRGVSHALSWLLLEKDIRKSRSKSLNGWRRIVRGEQTKDIHMLYWILYCLYTYSEVYRKCCTFVHE